MDISVVPGANLLESAIAAGIRISASCGGAGVCGTCRVLIEKGEVLSEKTNHVSPEDYKRGVRQACNTRVMSDLIVRILPESRLESAVMKWELGGTSSAERLPLVSGWRFDPPVRKIYLELTPPSSNDNTGDLTRLLNGLNRLQKAEYRIDSLGVLQKLAAVLRRENWRVTVTVMNGSIIDIEPGDTRSRFLSLAFDIGTTAVRGQLLDLNRGKVLAQAIDYNGQIPYGQDIISRIAHCRADDGLGKLQRAVAGTLNSLIRQMTEQAGARVDDIAHVVIAANTVMVHLLFGLDPQYLRLSPYVPTVNFAPAVKARSLGLETGEHVNVYALPMVASYIGGDIVSGVMATGIHQRNTVTLYIDIGTNSEMVIGNSEWMVTAACSAGPTFEGGGIRHGMIATEGAIEGFKINPSDLEPSIAIIGNERAKGICGSGLINLAAGLLRSGIITQNGKFNAGMDSSRIRKGDDGYEYVLERAAKTQIGQDIVITEADIDNLIRSKAAIYAGCRTLLKAVSTGLADIGQVIIAGTFGCSIDIENAITIGLLPDLPRERFVFIGNGSLLGARLVSFSEDLRRQAEKVASTMTSIELSESSDFMDSYVAALFLPHTDSKQFPSVKIEPAGRL